MSGKYKYMSTYRNAQHNSLASQLGYNQPFLKEGKMKENMMPSPLPQEVFFCCCPSKLILSGVDIV